MRRKPAGAAFTLVALLGGSCAPTQGESARPPEGPSAESQTRPARARARPASGEDGERPRSRSAPEAVMIQGDPMYKVLPPDTIPSIDDPRLVKASEAPHMEESEPVLGVEIDGQAHAYPLYLLDHHEIVNDEVGGRAIAATW